MEIMFNRTSNQDGWTNSKGLLDDRWLHFPLCFLWILAASFCFVYNLFSENLGHSLALCFAVQPI